MSGRDREGAHLDNLSRALLGLHKVLLDGERLSYERVHGRIASNGEFLQLVLGDSWFAWLRPLSHYVAQLDELTGRHRTASDAELDALLDSVRSLLTPTEGGEGFGGHYYDALQRVPEVGSAHAQVKVLLGYKKRIQGGGMMSTDLEKVKKLAKDLRTSYPRSPREKLGGYVIAARCVDKCRAFLVNMNGEYNYWPCSLASQWFSFTDITSEQFKDAVATGATDEELASWIASHSKVKDPDEVLKWNNRLRDMKLSDMSLQAQQYLEEYIPKFVPNHRPVYVWFDVYDLEEKRF
ncbi:MAG TPA: DUF5069 domain-containing protein [Nitrospiraceae bacterium]|nr:DUF5069 domain-containing protein [Nitrospiraceae bacterium]